uniref:Bactericidal permeability-increasing protein n=1 Tax=Pogona vitticeps TaxID=103695 RepID=A0ABM5G4M5_9SAUR
MPDFSFAVKSLVLHMSAAHQPQLQKGLWGFSLLLLASFTQPVKGEDGGLKVQVTRKGLEYAKDFGLEMLKVFAKKEQIQDISGSYNVPLLGAVSYTMSGIRVTQFEVTHSTAAFMEGTGLNLTIHNAQVSLSSRWSLSSWLADSLGMVGFNATSSSLSPSRSEDGTVDISLNRLFLSSLLGLGKDARGRPRVSYAGCHSALGDVELKFHGGKSWLYNLLAAALKGILQTEVNKQLCPEVKKGIGKLDHLLSAMNVSAQIDSFVGLDYSLVNEPSVGVDQCTVDLKGEFFQVRGHPGPLLPAPFHLPNQPDSMVLLGISEFFANSAAFAYFTSGALRVNYTGRMIPKTVPFRLNTKNLGVFIPELNKEFPDMEMEIHIAARKPPVLSIHPGSLEGAAFASVEAFAVLPNANLASAFLLNIEANLTGQVFLRPVQGGTSIGNVAGSLALKSFHLSVERSSIGEIKVALLESFLKMAGQMALLRANSESRPLSLCSKSSSAFVSCSIPGKAALFSYASFSPLMVTLCISLGYLKKGFALPSANGLSVLNPKVTMEQGYLLIATDLSMEPERLRESIFAPGSSQ